MCLEAWAKTGTQSNDAAAESRGWLGKGKFLYPERTDFIDAFDSPPVSTRGNLVLFKFHYQFLNSWF